MNRRLAIVFGQLHPARSASVGDLPEVLGALREMLARILRCDPWEIEEKATFHVMGLDSILGAEFAGTQRIRTARR
ncbi:acyl carrier protein [Streptomyces sp. NBC_00046]|uniref:acyl carrier protein n=1 Tax=Streptomyces sp. NBC_00046 TaxID=2975626 RepID=UPI002F912572